MDETRPPKMAFWGFVDHLHPGTPGLAPGSAEAKAYVAEGRDIVVDIDLEKFFDRVNHDILMARLGRWVGDKRMLRLIGRFLRAGLMQNGVCVNRQKSAVAPVLERKFLGHRLLPGGRLGIAPPSLERARGRL